MTPAAPLIVLDTNIVLDCLLFRNPECSLLQAALNAGELRWVATGAMRRELEHVLARQQFGRWKPDANLVSAQWDRLCAELPAPPAAATGRPRCTDPDDQKFIDLALACGARWLLSRDRAVLKLARRLHVLGVQVCAPGDWSLPDTSP